MTFCFILFTLAYAFSISITQAAAYSGVAAWLVQPHLNHSWNKTKFILIWPIGLFFLAGVLSVVTVVDSELSLSGIKKFLKGIVFFWAMNALALTRTMYFLIHLSQRLKISKIPNFIEVRTRSLKNASPLEIIHRLEAEDIEARPVWKPLHLQPVFKECQYYPYQPESSFSDKVFENGLCLPSGTNLQVTDQNRIVSLILDIL